ncbi:hypothetical protein Kfla_3512 [Kribbella flavida DSM 17836]|uniref:Lipoprotein n=1 Tax=Kribbella flavida (strain DSM 17836 / JCM 10339 / NBRC 14399) TaxID=479435 RepID=D2PLZ0_KRIFD|nr:hypothetical protein [Kribbella flavida]ADB32570.1 hypothetical protein Kfla_3512 [Kribbella flavida DSM 17836]
MRRSRFAHVILLTAGLTGPAALAACSADDPAGGAQAPAPTTVPVSTPITAPTGTPVSTSPPGDVSPSVPATPPSTPPSKAPSPKPTTEFVPQPGYDRAAFARSIPVTNKWLPLRPGMRMTFRGQTIEDGEVIGHTVTSIVTDLTKVIDGVRNVVVWDRDYRDGVLEEAELAFFAQAANGDVWHFGQYPEVYEEGRLVENPTWIHGVKGARAGITITADPGGPSYAQGWGPAVGWSDRAKTYRTNQRTCVAAGCFSGVLVTDEYSKEEPGAHQLKYYAPGVGNVRVGFYGNDPTKETLELTSARMLSTADRAEARAEALKLEKSAYRHSKDVYAHTAPAR